MSEDVRQAPSPLIRLAIDLGPMVVFFAAFTRFNLYVATGALMAAVLVALGVGYIRERRLAPMPLFTTVLVMIFGGLTLYLKNDTFIKMKPTAFYAMMGLLLLGGLAFNRLFIKYVFAQAFELSEEGWRKLTWRWGFFALGLAVLNEIVWRNFSNTIWVIYHTWGVMPLIFLFAVAQTPLVLKHDVAAGKEAQS